MTPSNRTRERAAQLCSMAACSGTMVITACRHLAVRRRSPARALAFLAVSYACGHVTKHPYAEAEALIRTGWLP